MNHQAVTSILKGAGLVSQAIVGGVLRKGYQACKLSGSVGVLCGPYPVEQIAQTLVDAGLSVYQRPEAARDALFVRQGGAA